MWVFCLRKVLGSGEASNESYYFTPSEKRALLTPQFPESDHEFISHYKSNCHGKNATLVPMARGRHLFPSRTQKLSLSAVTILGSSRPGKIARCQIIKEIPLTGVFFYSSVCYFPVAENTGVPDELVRWGFVTVPNYKKDPLIGGIFLCSLERIKLILRITLCCFRPTFDYRFKSRQKPHNRLPYSL